MAFDPSRPAPTPREAASVILVRARAGSGQAEIFLLRRHRKSSFMGSSFVFPGGAADEGDADARATAARELFEEAGILLAERPVDAATAASWREQLHAGADLTELLASADAALALDALSYFAHWITPAAESKRFSARFFLAELPAGQTPSFDNRETVDEIWVTPDEALARAGELRLPPPQVRTMHEMRDAAQSGPAALFALAAERARHPHAVLPRFAPMSSAPKGFALLLPWDPEYDTAGVGEGLAIPHDHPLAVGPSRFVLDDVTWKNIDAPSSPAAD